MKSPSSSTLPSPLHTSISPNMTLLEQAYEQTERKTLVLPDKHSSNKQKAIAQNLQPTPPAGSFKRKCRSSKRTLGSIGLMLIAALSLAFLIPSFAAKQAHSPSPIAQQTVTGSPDSFINRWRNLPLLNTYVLSHFSYPHIPLCLPYPYTLSCRNTLIRSARLVPMVWLQ
jgi:hypothetical protein